jgi:hypothetical protein
MRCSETAPGALIMHRHDASPEALRKAKALALAGPSPPPWQPMAISVPGAWESRAIPPLAPAQSMPVSSRDACGGAEYN